MARRKPDTVTCPVERYARAVVDGRIAAGKWVRLACERHLRDLKGGAARGLRWDSDAAQHAIEFFGFLRHSKGEWAGVRFELSDWQQFIVGCLFGWKWASTGHRRFRVAYVEIARKNGKSTLAAGIGLYLLVADDEPGAEIYSAATKKDQAKIIHTEATNMVRASPDLRVRVRTRRNNLHVVATGSKYEPLSADAKSHDGLNPHGVIADEVHAWEQRLLWDVLDTAMGARRQPLMLAITTAGQSQESVCWEQHDCGERILDRAVEDDAVFVYIANIDAEDDWTDEACWVKANPNLGVSVKLDYLRAQLRKALASPAAASAFKRLHLNVWGESAEDWLPIETWDASAGMVVPENLRGATCYGGLDLASSIDIAAFVRVFPRERPDGQTEYMVLCDFFIPAENMVERERRDKVPYSVWVAQGFIAATPGNVIDHGAIKQRIHQRADETDLQEVAFDRWGAVQLTQELAEEGLTMVPFGQGFASMSAPTKEVMRLVMEGKIRHGGNPVLRWMARGMKLRQDPAGNLKPDKKRSTARIDGMVALIMALDRAIRNEGGGSVYDERGVVVL